MGSASLEKRRATMNLQCFSNGYDMWAEDWELASRIPGLIQTQPFEENTQITRKESLSIELSHGQLKVRLSNTLYLPDSAGEAQTWESGMKDCDFWLCHSQG